MDSYVQVKLNPDALANRDHVFPKYSVQGAKSKRPLDGQLQPDQQNNGSVRTAGSLQTRGLAGPQLEVGTPAEALHSDVPDDLHAGLDDRLSL